ncbi:MAG: glycosyltransferase, partial [Patescibacteria group bacterium]
VHICYCLSPPRHLYGYETDFPWRKFFLVRHLASWGNKLLRWYDQLAVGRVSTFLAISQEVAQRIKRFYGRRAMVVYPPLLLSVSSNKSVTLSGNYYLVVARLSPMKHIDLVIAACRELGRQLKVVGIGPERRRLQLLSDETVELLGQVSDTQLRRLYTSCRAVICAARDEDLGLVPIEAMSFGKPVVAYQSGGYKETVINGKTGVFFSELSVASLIAALRLLESLAIKPVSCRRRAQQFSSATFIYQIRQIVLTAWKQKLKTTGRGTC